MPNAARFAATLVLAAALMPGPLRAEIDFLDTVVGR